MARYQEYTQTDFGIERVRSWAKMTGRLKDNDLLISGNVDEILYPSTQLGWVLATKVLDYWGRKLF